MPLQTLDQDLKAPKSRIGSAIEATSMAFNMIRADERRAMFRTHINGLIDGNAPYQNSRKDRTNLNFRQATAIMNQFQSPYYDLIVEVPLLWDVQTAFGNSEERADWSQIISEELHRMVTSWEDWDFIMQLNNNQMLRHGVGTLYWHDNIDWRPDCGLVGEILVEDQAPRRLSELEVVTIRKQYTSSNLMRYIEDEKTARELGWNPEEVKLAIRDSYSGSTQPPDQSSAYEWFQSKYKNSDIYFGTSDCKRIWSAHVLNIEFDGKVSHHIVRTDQRRTEFLYSKTGRFDSFYDVMCPFFYDIGNGTWHSVRGLGTEIYPYCQIFNKLRCREVDAAMIAASVMVQAKDGTAAKQAQMLTLDNLKIIPEGLSFVDHAIGQNISATVDVRRDMESGMVANIGGLQPTRTSGVYTGQKQAMLEMQQAAQLGKGKINQYYASLDKLGHLILKRAANPKLTKYSPGGAEAIEFQQRCIKRGVPKEALRDIDTVKAYRSVGAGSAANAMIITESLMQLAPSLSEPGRMAAMRMYISRLAGTKTADLLIGEVKTQEKRTDQDWQAGIENQMLRQGSDGQQFLADDQSDVVHAKVHIGDMAQHVQEVMQSQEQDINALQGLYVHLEAAGPHTHDHLARIANDKVREGDYKQLFAQWNQIAKVADQVKNNLQQAMEAQEEQGGGGQGPQINPELLRQIPYKNAPESVKQQIEILAGIPRQQGDASVDSQNITIKGENLQIKKQTAQRKGIIDDIKTSQEVQRHRNEFGQIGEFGERGEFGEIGAMGETNTIGRMGEEQ